MILKDLKAQIKHIKNSDPAACSSLSIILLYPSIHVMFFYRIGNFLYRHKLKCFGRMITGFGRFLTGIEIHPGATIGSGIFIDHGMGVVIGETAIIGDYVKLFHGVTLGGVTSKKGKRHPIIGNNVMIGANSIILGNIVVGDNARIGAGSVVLKDVEPNTTVVGNPATIKANKSIEKQFIEQK